MAEDLDILQQILKKVSDLSNDIDSLKERMSVIEQLYEELTSVDPEDIGGYEPDNNDDSLGMHEYLETIGDALQMILANQQELMSRFSDDALPDKEELS